MRQGQSSSQSALQVHSGFRTSCLQLEVIVQLRLAASENTVWHELDIELDQVSHLLKMREEQDNYQFYGLLCE